MIDELLADLGQIVGVFVLSFVVSFVGWLAMAAGSLGRFGSRFLVVGALLGALVVPAVAGARASQLTNVRAPLASTSPSLPAMSPSPSLASGAVTTVAGSGTQGSGAGTGSGASFFYPTSVAVTGGYAYVTDPDVVFRVTLTGANVGTSVVWAGAGGSQNEGCGDGSPGTSARVNNPLGIATDGSYLYTVDSGCGVRRISLTDGTTTTLSSQTGSAITVGSDGNVYILGSGSPAALYRLTLATGAVTALTGLPSGPSTSGCGISADTSGDLFVCVRGSGTAPVIDKYVLSSGAVSTTVTDPELGNSVFYFGGYLYASVGINQGGTAVRLCRYSVAGGAGADVAGGAPGHRDGTAGLAEFGNLTGVATDGTNLFLSDQAGGYLRQLAPGVPLTSAQQSAVGSTPTISNGGATTVAGGSNGSAPGVGSSTGFYTPTAVAVLGGYAYVADPDVIMRVTLSGSNIGTTVVWSGATGGQNESCTDGSPGSNARINRPTEMVTDGTFLYTSSPCGIRRTDAVDGSTTTIMTTPASGVTWGSDGQLYVTGVGSPATLYKLNPANDVVTALSGLPTDSSHSAAGITADTGGALYVALRASNGGATVIDKDVLSTATVTTLVTDAELAGPVYYANGQIYAAVGVNAGSNATRLRRYSTSTGVGADVAGGPPGHRDGTAGDAEFGAVQGVTSDGTNLYVVDQGMGTIGYLRKVSTGTALPGGQIASVGGGTPISYGAVSTVSGPGFYTPGASAVTGGYAYLADPDVIFRTTTSGSNSSAVWAGLGGYQNVACTDGSPGSGARIDHPTGMATDGSFVYSTGPCGVRRTDLVDGSTVTLSTLQTTGVTLGSDRMLYVTGSGSPVTLYRLNPTNDVLSLLGGLPADTTLSPCGITSGTSGDLYLCLASNAGGYTLEKYTISTAGATVLASFPTPSQGIHRLQGLAYANGQLYAGYYVSQPVNGTQEYSWSLISIGPSTGSTTVIAGGALSTTAPTATDGTGPQAGFGNITSIDSDGGSLYVVDNASGGANGELRKVVAAPPPPIPTAQTYGPDGLLGGSGGSGGGCGCSNGADGSTSSGGTGDPVNTVTGAQTYSVTDASTHALGAPFAWTRAYTSADTTAGPLGVGWTFPYNASLTVGTGGEVTLRAEDGQQAIFTPATGIAYTSPPGIRSVLSGSATSGWTLTTRDHHTDTFSAGGQLMSRRDRFSQGVTLGYSAGKLATVTDQAGRTVTVGWSGSMISGFTLADGRSVGYSYTGGQLTGVTDLRGDTWTYGYTSGLLSSVTDPNGHTVFADTYTSGRVTSQLDGRGKTTSFGWNAATTTATTTDPRGGVTTDVYSGNVLVKRTTPAGTTSYAYDQLDNLASVTDPRGYSTDYRYDGNANMVAEDDPQGLSSKRYTYDANNNVTAITDGRGNTTGYAYDGSQRLMTVTDPTNAATTLTYATGNEVATATDRRGKVTRYGYDAAGDKTSMTSPLGEVTTYGYDSSGRRTTVTDPRGNVTGATPATYTTTSTYDNGDEVTQVAAPAGRTSSTVFDPVGRPTTITDPVGNVTTLTYDQDNHVLTATQHPATGVNAVTTTSYDDSGNVASVAAPDGGLTTYTYDLANRRLTTRLPLGNVSGASTTTQAAYTTTKTYDADGDVTTVKRLTPVTAATQTTTDSYDALDRLTTVTDPLGHTTSTTYNPNNDIVTSVDGVGDTTTNTYDTRDWKTAVKDPRGQTTTRTYDTEGHVLTSTTPTGGTTSHTYDDDGRRLTTVDPRGNVSGGTPSAYTTTLAYDPAGSSSQSPTRSVMSPAAGMTLAAG